MNIFVGKYRQRKAKKDFILIPVKSITGSDVVIVVSGQSFPQIVLLEQTWDSSKREFGPASPRGAESLMEKASLVAATSSPPAELPFPWPFLYLGRF